jgi:hypothetical protein
MVDQAAAVENGQWSVANERHPAEVVRPDDFGKLPASTIDQ